MRAYVDNIKYEISGLGKIELIDNDLVVRDIRIFRQKVTGGSTVMDHKALGKFYDEILQTENDLSQWKLWWHSHGDLEAFWSGTDVATIEDFDSEMAQDNWMVSLVTNHDAQTKIRIDIFKPLRCTVNDIPYDISFDDPVLENNVLDEIAEKVEIQVPVSRKSSRNITKWNKPYYSPKLFGTESETVSSNGIEEVILPGEDGYRYP